MNQDMFKRNINHSLARIGDEIVYMMQLIDSATAEDIPTSRVYDILVDLMDEFGVTKWRLSRLED